MKPAEIALHQQAQDLARNLRMIDTGVKLYNEVLQQAAALLAQWPQFSEDVVSAIEDIDSMIKQTTVILNGEILAGNVVKEAAARGEIVGLRSAKDAILRVQTGAQAQTKADVATEAGVYDDASLGALPVNAAPSASMLSEEECVRVHELKCWPPFFQAILDGKKPFEIRKDDRDYKVGDMLLLREFEPRTRSYLGRETRVMVTYKIPDTVSNLPSAWGLESGHCVMGIATTVNALCDLAQVGRRARGKL